MSVDAHVPSGSAKALSLAIRYMLLCLGIAVLLGHAKIDDVHQVGMFCVRSSHKEVVWLDISVNQILFVDRLDTAKLWRCERGRGYLVS